MGIYLVFCFVLLLGLKQAATAQQSYGSSCEKKCGNISITKPFGIKTGCYRNSWFRVTCNETANGPKPFISRINLELLSSSKLDYGGNVAVNNPVTYVSCGNNGNNGTTAPISVNLTGTPFFFSSRYNLFGSVGCGNLATFSRDNQTDPIGGCLQQRCGDTNGRLGGCYAVLPENLTSFTAALTEVINFGEKENRKRCTSAFIFDMELMNKTGSDLEFPHDISIHTTHVPARLHYWEPLYCGGSVTPECKEVEATGVVPDMYACTERCGNVEITYPFGIKPGCFINEWFRVTCNETTDGPKPFISSINMQLLGVSFLEGRVIINNSRTYFTCLNKDEDLDNNGVSVNLTGSPFYFSDIFNRFVSVGCGSLATILRNPTDIYPVVGCLQPRCNNIATSSISCIAEIPAGLSSFTLNMTEIYPSNGTKRSCGSASIIDMSTLLDLGGTIIPDHKGTSSWSWPHVPTALQRVTQKVGSFPTTLQWGIPKAGQCWLKEETFCSSDGKYCWTSWRTGHLCVCTLEANSQSGDYTDVCQELGRCEDLKYRYCRMLCLNAPGNYCSSSCPDGYAYSSMEKRCRPIDQLTGSSLFRTTKMSRNLPIIVGFSTFVGTAFVLLGTLHVYKALKRRKNIKLKQKYFKRNGGLLLQQQLSSNEGNVQNIKLFASKELEKATDHYNKNRILGQGGQGTVYKGMLTDGSIVAIKKSKMVEEKILDEKKLKQFINEVIILSQINHRNVVKLLGCCLETQVPLLVYEFIPNGTLYQLIHDQNEEFPLTWKMRLRIATETANALSYLHSAASAPIYHRDIKSSNILLDDKYKAKVSDFGTSKSVALEQTHLTTQVQGTFGYMDPEYFRSSKFTEKSDVYSFAVVLVELLTGQKPVFSAQSAGEVARSLVNLFLSSMEENSLFDILDSMVKNDGPEEEIMAIATLAKRCLNLNGKRRPKMKQVAVELEWIRASEEVNVVQQSSDEDSDIDEDEIESFATDSCSTSRSIVSDSVILPILDEHS